MTSTSWGRVHFDRDIGVLSKVSALALIQVVIITVVLKRAGSPEIFFNDLKSDLQRSVIELVPLLKIAF